MKSAESWSSPTHIQNFDLAVFNDSDNVSRFNFSGKLLMNLQRLLLSFEVKRKTSLASKSYEIDIFKSNVDSCNVAKGIVGNYIINFILSGLDEYSNLAFECPMRKGFVFIYNFPVPAQPQDFLPKFVPMPTQNSA